MAEEEQQQAEYMEGLYRLLGKRQALVDLLRYLYVRRGQEINSKEMSAALGLGGEDTGALRVRCRELRDCLHGIQSREMKDARWKLIFLPTDPQQGYSVTLVDRSSLPSFTENFWQAHLETGRPVMVVYNEPVFYRDRETHQVLRFDDLNPDDGHSPREMIEALKVKNPEIETSNLHPCFLYLLAGEVAARDALADWFSRHGKGCEFRRGISRRVQAKEMAECSPILLGSPRTNRYMRQALKPQHAPGLAYRVAMDTVGNIHIPLPTKEERRKIAEWGAKHPGAVEEEGLSGRMTLIDRPWPDEYVYALITRFAHTPGEGPVTMICSHYTRAVERLAALLTNENNLQRMTPPAWIAGLPSVFQALLAVRTGPSDVDAEAGHPELLLYRSYSV